MFSIVPHLDCTAPLDDPWLSLYYTTSGEETITLYFNDYDSTAAAGIKPPILYIRDIQTQWRLWFHVLKSMFVYLRPRSSQKHLYSRSVYLSRCGTLKQQFLETTREGYQVDKIIEHDGQERTLCLDMFWKMRENFELCVETFKTRFEISRSASFLQYNQGFYEL